MSSTSKTQRNRIFATLASLVLLFVYAFCGVKEAQATAGYVTGKFNKAYNFNGQFYVDAGNVGTGIKSAGFWVNGTSAGTVLDFNGSSYVSIAGGVVSATGFTATIYVDGVAGTAVDSNWHYVVVTTTDSIDASAVKFGSVGFNSLIGLMDDVKFYNYALSTREIYEKFMGGTSSLASGGTVDGSLYLMSSGYLGLGTTSPTSKLAVAGGIGIGSTAANSVYHSLAVAQDGGLIVEGNVGIGTTTPTGKLDIRGDEVRIWTGAGTNTNALASGELYVEGDLEVDGTVYGASVSYSGNITMAEDTWIGIGSTGERFVFDGSGNVLGVYDAGLRIYDSTDSDYINIAHDGTDVNITTNGTGEINLDNDLDLALTLKVGSSITNNDDYIYFDDGSSEYLMWDESPGQFVLSDDFVPSADDTLNLGAANMRWNDLYLGAGTIHIGTTNTDEYTIGYDTTANRLEFNVNGSGNAEIVMDSNGYLGIGTTTPAAALDVNGTAWLRGTGTSGLFVDSSGEVGIGTTNATQKLEVAGNMLVGSDATNNDDYIYFDGGTSEYLAWDESPGEFDISDDLNVDNNISLGAATTNNDDYLYFDDGSSEYLMWDESENQFHLSDNLILGSSQLGSGQGDLTAKGSIEMASIASPTDTYVYDTAKDSDGGAWRNNSNAKASSWYNETLNDTDRGSTREFPAKAILVATSSYLYIYDAKDNTLWMRFDQNAASYMIGADTNNNPSSVFALNGKIYLGANGSSAEGLYVLDFKTDGSNKYNATDDYVGNKTIANRNAATTYSTGPGSPIVNAVVNDVHGKVINGKTYVAVATDAGVSVINATDQKVYDYADVADDDVNQVWLDSAGNLWALNETQVQLEKWNLVTSDSADENPGTPDSTWDETTTPALWVSAPTMPTTPGALTLTNGTSTVDGKSATVYVTSSLGLSVLQTKQGDESNGSVKYYNSSEITEEMVGDIRGMWSLNESTLTDGAAIDDKSVNDADLQVVSGATSASGVRGKGLTFNGSTQYLKQQVIDDATGASFGPTYHGLSLAATAAFMRVQGVDLSPYASAGNDYMIVVSDGEGDKAWGYIDNADVAEALGSELTPNNTAVSDGQTEANATTGWSGWGSPATFESTSNGVPNVGSYHFHIVNNDVGQTDGFRVADANPFSLTAGKLYKLSFDYKVVSGANLRVLVYDGSGYPLEAYFSSTTYTSVSRYFTSTATGTSMLYFQSNYGVSEFYVDNVSLKEVTDVGTDGVHIMSTKGGSTQSWAGISASFNYNASAYTFEVRETEFQITGNLSVGAWFKPAATTASKFPFAKSDYSAFQLQLTSAATFYVGYGSASATTTIVAGTWYYIVGVWDGSKVRIYINGLEENSGNGANPLDVPGAFGIAARDYQGGGFGAFWNGTIDEPFVTAEALTPAQIKHMYEVGKRALQMHNTSADTDDDGSNDVDDLQKLQNGEDDVYAVAVDDGNQVVFTGSGNGSDGAVSVIALDSDTRIDTYTEDKGKYEDDGATRYDISNLTAISVSGYYNNQYQLGSKQTSNNQFTLAIAGTDDSANGTVWMESADISLYSTLATLTSPTLTKNNLQLKSSLIVGSDLWVPGYDGTNATPYYISNPSFEVTAGGDIIIGANVNKAQGATGADQSNRIAFRSWDSAVNAYETVYLWYDASEGDLVTTAAALNVAGSYDVAEFFRAPEGEVLEAGTVVSISNIKDQRSKMGEEDVFITASTKPYDQQVLGVVSTRPGLKLGGALKEQNGYPVSLAGRVPVKVSLENGAIKKGDFLTSSSVPGYAMKACSSDGRDTIAPLQGDGSNVAAPSYGASAACRPGMVIGRALQDFDGTEDGIEFVELPEASVETFDRGRDRVSPLHEPGTESTESAVLAEASSSASPTTTYNLPPTTSSKVPAKKILVMVNVSWYGGGSNGESRITNTATGLGINDDISVETIAKSLTINQNLTVLGATSLNHLSVASSSLFGGNLLINELGDSIGTLTGDLKLQPLARGNLDIFSGKVVFTTEGSLHLTEGVLYGNDSMRGVVAVGVGESQVFVARSWKEAPVSVTLTPSYNTKVWVTDLTKDGFTANVSSAPAQEEKVYWLAIW